MHVCTGTHTNTRTCIPARAPICAHTAHMHSHEYIHTCTHKHIRMYTHTHRHTTCAIVHICAPAHSHTCAHIHSACTQTHAYVYAHMHMGARTWPCTPVHLNTHTCVHVRAHMPMNMHTQCSSRIHPHTTHADRHVHTHVHASTAAPCPQPEYCSSCPDGVAPPAPYRTLLGCGVLPSLLLSSCLAPPPSYYSEEYTLNLKAKQNIPQHED